jgi:large subunit ribosomal protein L10
LVGAGIFVEGGWDQLAISRERKEELVRQYTERLQASKALVLVDYQGVRVAESEQLRRSLRENEATLQVVKNRMLKLALAQVGIELPQEWLDGPTAIAFCRGEVPTVAKVLGDFAQEVATFSIKGGLMETAVLSVEQIAVLANLPPRPVLLAQVLGAFNAPASQLVGAVAGGIRQVLNVLQAYVDKLESADPAPQAA